jgi:hypothetical protein
MGKRAEQLSDEELKAALPSMLFTTSNLIWSSECAGQLAVCGGWPRGCCTPLTAPTTH